MKITLCGLAGTGTSTLAKILAESLGCERTSSGDMFRQLAQSKGITLAELEALSEKDPKFDNELDEAIAQYGQSHVDCVIDSRLAWHFVPDSLKVKLDCDYHVRISRVAERDNISFEQAEKETREREESIADRYLRYYNISDFLADDNFDLIINTTQINPEEAKEIIINYINQS